MKLIMLINKLLERRTKPRKSNYFYISEAGKKWKGKYPKNLKGYRILVRVLLPLHKMSLELVIL